MKIPVAFLCLAFSAAGAAATVWVDENAPAPASPYLTEQTAARSLEEAVSAAQTLVAEGETAVTVRLKDGTYEVADEIRVNNKLRIESVNGPSAVSVVQTTENCRVFAITAGTVSGVTVRSLNGVSTASVKSTVGASYGYGV